MEKTKTEKPITEKGLPAICVPLTGRTFAEVIKQAEEAARSEADIAEWRVDLCEEFFDESGGRSRDPGDEGKPKTQIECGATQTRTECSATQTRTECGATQTRTECSATQIQIECGATQGLRLKHMLSEIRKHLGDKALLFTVRTAKEGGAADINGETYEKLLEAALEAGVNEEAADKKTLKAGTNEEAADKKTLKAGMNEKAASEAALEAERGGRSAYRAETGEAAGKIDMIDIEMSAGEGAAGRLAGLAKKAGITSIISSHDFEKTPSDEKLETLVKNMEKTGADIVKIAVMPKCREDVERICALAEKIKNGLIKRPYILISMGEMGKRTRLEAEKMGSFLTFGALTEEQLSAPGQIAAAELKREIIRRHRP